MASPEEHRSVALSAAQNLAEQRKQGASPPETGEPESDRPTRFDKPQVQRTDRPQADWSAKQRPCSHPAAVVKRFADGLSYCRLGDAC